MYLGISEQYLLVQKDLGIIGHIRPLFSKRPIKYVAENVGFPCIVCVAWTLWDPTSRCLRRNSS
jgi:hypothetical protein